MHFDWSDEQRLLLRNAYDFADRNLNHGLNERFSEGRLCKQSWSHMGTFGALGLCLPPEFGGLGFDTLTAAGMMESLGEGCKDLGLLFSAAAHQFACAEPIAKAGAEDLKERLLPRLADGRAIGANAITEAEAGSDIAALKTSAVRSDDGYVLQGSKSYVSNGPVADVFIVYATTDPSAGYLGITAFCVERDTPGLVIGERICTMGMETAPISSLYLDNCRVPLSHRIGDEGGGSAIFAESMQSERTCLFAIYLGVMKRQLNLAIEHARNRRQFRRPIARFQSVAHRIADMKLHLDSSRLLLYRACWERDQGRTASLAVSLAKLATSEGAVAVGMDMIRVFGGAGVMTEVGVERGLRDAVPSLIFSGTSDIQRNLIAKELGL